MVNICENKCEKQRVAIEDWKPKGRVRITPYTAKRLFALQHVGEKRFSDILEDVLDCTPATAKRFRERVLAGDRSVIYHGNLERRNRKYDDAWTLVRQMVKHGYGRGFSSVGFCEVFKAEGVVVPSPRTVRWWVRELCRVKRRRSRRRVGGRASRLAAARVLTAGQQTMPNTVQE